MFRFTRTLLNNINQLKYLKNINLIELKTNRSTTDTETKDLSEQKKNYSIDELVHLETEVRVSNLKVFAEVYTKLRVKRFFTISLPAVLTAITIGTFCTPTRHDEVANVDVCKGTFKLYNSELGEAEYTKDYYQLEHDESIFTTRISEDNEKQLDVISKTTENTITFKMYDDIDSIFAKFTIDSDGKMSLYEISFDDIFDINDYESYEFKKLDDNYMDLTNRIIKALNASDEVDDEEKEILNNLSESDKKVIITEVNKYVKIGEEELIVSKTNVAKKIILAFITALYIFIEATAIADEEEKVFSCYINKLKNHYGMLYGREEDVGLIFGPVSCREEFVAAERERINRIKKELYENTICSDPNRSPILTRYERKLK